MGRIVTVTEEDFLVKQDKDYGIINRTYQQIYNFFSRQIPTSAQIGRASCRERV